MKRPIAGVGEAQAADQARDARKVWAEAEGGQDHGQPEKGGGAVASRAEVLEGTPPGQPEEMRAFGKMGVVKRVVHFR